MGSEKGEKLALLVCTFPLFFSLSPQSDKWGESTPLAAGKSLGGCSLFSAWEPRECFSEGAEAPAGFSEQDGARDDTLGPGDSPLPWMEEAVPLQCPKLRALEAVGTSESVGQCNGCGSRGKVNSWGPLEEVDVKYACIRQLGAVGQFVIM